jgi:hypothetical protein
VIPIRLHEVRSAKNGLLCGSEGPRVDRALAVCIGLKSKRGITCMAKLGSETRLTNPSASVKSAKVGRNELCPCGSGKKYKRCCAEKEATYEQASSASGRFRYEPGSYGSAVAGYMPSILCYESSGPDSWRDHFCLVNPDAVFQYDDEAATTIAQDHLATAYSLRAGPERSETLERAGNANSNTCQRFVDRAGILQLERGYAQCHWIATGGGVSMFDCYSRDDR